MSRSRIRCAATVLFGLGCTYTNPTTNPVPAPITTSNTLSPSNPFYSASTLQYQAPPFDRIKDTDFQPAIEEGMRQDLADMEAVANRADAPTFDNTILAMERSGLLLTRVTNVFDALNSANTNGTLQKVDETESPRRAAHYDEIYLNPKLFARVKSIYDSRTTLGLDPTQQYLVERYYKNFVRAGALLSDADKTRLRALNEEESKLTSQFHNRLLAATKGGALVVDNPADL